MGTQILEQAASIVFLSPSYRRQVLDRFVPNDSEQVNCGSKSNGSAERCRSLLVSERSTRRTDVWLG